MRSKVSPQDCGALAGHPGASWALSALCVGLTANLSYPSWVIIAETEAKWSPEICYQRVGNKDSGCFWR